ncbi:unnamed protein product [Prunus armeniaca]|uniref:Uncharacterized protein n=1 Tax=Prunus armeniaca TaxID=36596 RepID=A0A6J5WLV1_PRUAR|nr:unnamed protein product [Prunus armeniaca]
MDQAPTPAYDHFPPHRTTNQASYRMAPTTSAPYSIGGKQRDNFQGRLDGNKRNKDSGGRNNFRSPKNA